MKQLKEIFDNPFPYKKINVTGSIHHNYAFSSGKHNYSVQLSHNNEEAEVGFRNRTSGTYDGYKENGSEKSHAARIYSTVKKIMKDHAVAHPEIKAYKFNGYTERQDNLYKNIVKKKYPKAQIGRTDIVVPVNEIMDSNYPYSKNSESYKGVNHDMHWYRFNSPHSRFEVEIAEPHDKTKNLNVSFSSNKGGVGVSGHEGKAAHRVFSTVHHIIKKHLEDSGVSGVEFTSDKDNDNISRSKLYSALANKYAHKHEKKSVSNVGSGFDEFKIKKNDLK